MDLKEDRWKSAEAIFNSLWTNLVKIISISPDWTVAEFGIGKWGFGRFYAQKVRKVYGIDIIDYSSVHPGVEFYLSDGKVTKIPEESVDLTVSHSVLEHVGDLDGALTEINRITRPNGYFYLTVNPLYYSSYGAHLNRGGKRLDNWEHLDPASEHYLTRNPLPGSSVGGHALNMLTSSMFLAAVGRQPWNILRYIINFESKRIPEYVDRSKSLEMDLTLRSFNFIGQKVKKQVTPSQRDSPMPVLTQSESAMKTIPRAMPANAVTTHTGIEKANAVVKALADYLELSSYGIVWNEGERSIPQIWSIYPTRRFVHFALLSLYEFAAANFTKDRIVLDFGCGVGYGSYRLGVRGAKFVHGIELDEQSVRFGQKYFCYPNIITECKNIHDLAADPTKHGIYDFVYCSNVMEHIPDYLGVLKSISNLLKSGGQYFHVTPPSGQPRGNPYHVTNFTIPEWRRIIEPFFPNQRYFAHIPTRNREEVISEYEFDFPECGPSDMGRLKSISGIILAAK